MSDSGDVEEEGHFVAERVAAHVAVEGVVEAVIAHVHRVHDAVSEGDVAVRTLEELALLVRTLFHHAGCRGGGGCCGGGGGRRRGGG